MKSGVATRREFLANAGLALVAGSVAAAPGTAQGAGLLANIQRELMLEMARSYKLGSNAREFKRLNSVMAAFRGIGAWPDGHLVVNDAMSALTRVLSGETLDRGGFRNVVRRSGPRMVVFSDHHIMPDANRQSGVWRANRAGYTKLLRHYGEEGWLVAENGDIEDLVILEPAQTVAAYEEVLEHRTGKAKIRSRSTRRLQEWFRSDPLELISKITEARRPRRRQQFLDILSSPDNAPYYTVLAELAASEQLVRVTGNHDHDLQQMEVEQPHLVPADILIFEAEGSEQPTVVMHGHQFDEATNPSVATLYGEVVSECLGVWYQGPDRSWSGDQIHRILSGGFPNRLATHGDKGAKAGVAGAFATALLAGGVADDEEWARTWEGLFGHPIAWEYGAEDWAASVRGALARPGRLIDDAMVGKQFFKFRHLDEAEVVTAMARWGFPGNLVLGHSHEVRAVQAGRIGRYYNSGAAGRFSGLIWAVEFGPEQPQVVAWHLGDDDSCTRYRFERRDGDLFSYFEALKTNIVLT